MLTLTLHVKPLNVNEAWQGRRFSTAAKKDYELRLRYSLPRVAVVGKPYYRVTYDFHLKNFAQIDYDNCIKVTQDCLVKRGIITDDCKIVEARIRKFPAKADRIVIGIEGCALDLPRVCRDPELHEKGDLLLPCDCPPEKM